MSLVQLLNVTKRYDDHLVLRDMYFQLSEGERVGLIGRNGSGQTTLLRLILGEEAPDEGQVERDTGLSMGHFSLSSTLDGEMSVVEVLEGVFQRIHEIEEELLEIEVTIEKGGAGAALERLLHRQAAPSSSTCPR